jgi:hypothetical protein
MIKYFLNQIDYLLARTFLRLQSRFTTVVIEYFRTFYLCNDFSISHGQLSDASVADRYFQKANLLLETSHSARGDISSDFSRCISLEAIEVEELLRHTGFESTIIHHYGSKYNATGSIIRNYNFDCRFSTAEVFSNIWHLDSDYGSRQTKIFILLHTVRESDGPLVYLDRSTTLKHWSSLRDRWSFLSFRELQRFPAERTFTGQRGDCLLINTSRCAHRASIPERHRDMIVISVN